jgi:hypothetical protein
MTGDGQAYNSNSMEQLKGVQVGGVVRSLTINQQIGTFQKLHESDRLDIDELITRRLAEVNHDTHQLPHAIYCDLNTLILHPSDWVAIPRAENFLRHLAVQEYDENDVLAHFAKPEAIKHMTPIPQQALSARQHSLPSTARIQQPTIEELEAPSPPHHQSFLQPSEPQALLLPCTQKKKKEKVHRILLPSTGNTLWQDFAVVKKTKEEATTQVAEEEDEEDEPSSTVTDNFTFSQMFESDEKAHHLLSDISLSHPDTWEYPTTIDYSLVNAR